jgi:predicted  nucleic acid-binding Zn-ribbon protein
MKKRVAHNKSNTEEFIKKALAVQTPLGREFDYSRVEYINARTKIEVGCKTCGTWFMQTPYVHLYAKGCSTCRNNSLRRARSHTKEQFVEAAKKIDNGRYCYDLVAYKNARTYVDILCNDCGALFKKKPTEILNGLGCQCHTDLFGYRPEEEGKLYILSCGDITKIGITNGDAAYRAKVVSKAYGEQFSVVAYYPMAGKKCSDIETIILNDLRRYHDSPKHKFDGYTECFYTVNRAYLYRRIDELIREYI